MNIGLTIDDKAVGDCLRQLIRLGVNLAPVMRDIAVYGESATTNRFMITQTGPDGQKWKPSRRVTDAKGKGLTLVDSGMLVKTISSGFSADYAEWGVNRVYAAIHQFGGVIRPKKARALRFRAGGKTIFRHAVTLPARPYLGLSDADRDEILTIINRAITQASGGAAHAA
jgi:phage virion morphogenesis protein